MPNQQKTKSFKWLISRDNIELLMKLGSPVFGYALQKSGYLIEQDKDADYDIAAVDFVLGNGDFVRVRANEGNFAFKFDCYTLSFEDVAKPNEDVTELVGQSGPNPNSVEILLRDEWLLPSEGDTSQLIGQNPLTQDFGPPGSAPASCISKCLVAAGIRIVNSKKDSIIIVVDDYPGFVQLLVDSDSENRILDTHKAVSVDEYKSNYL